jgi:hypothetical protein
MSYGYRLFSRTASISTPNTRGYSRPPARFQQVNGSQHVVAGVVLRIINGQRTSICASVRGHANMSFHEETGQGPPYRTCPRPVTRVGIISRNRR